jgi:hypothetical protein
MQYPNALVVGTYPPNQFRRGLTVGYHPIHPTQNGPPDGAV